MERLHTALETGKGIPEVVDSTATIVRADGKTTVTISHAGYGTCVEPTGISWEQAFDKLTAVLAKG